MSSPLETAAALPDSPSGASTSGQTETRPGLAGLTTAATMALILEAGHPAYRARQLADWVWRRHAAGVDEMRTLPAALRARLDAAFRASTLIESTVRPADGGLTEKALHRLHDGRLVESVLMRYPARAARRARATVCISSQAGCAVGCPFCATGELGFERDLDTAEIVDQVRFWARRLVARGERVTNVVFMGMGEPLLNLDAVTAAAAALTDPDRFGLGARHVTISTSGVLPGIERLTALRPAYTLAVSLHAARAALRDVLVPLNRHDPIERVVEAASAYSQATGRRVSYEYVMIDGINDTPRDAAEVASLLRGRQAHVNLIPMNPVAHTPWRPSRPERLEAFSALLRAAGLGVTLRRTRGEEIGAACGQLAAERAGAAPPSSVRRRRDLLVARGLRALEGVR